ncbi:MAG TPA: hypothetical protein PLY70_03030 [Saprospiraceae bacterium]|nr:hypothetical protein [Saprospiraceae bacterium]HPN68956.1 hypothetical protein [Saprospiraceae bacterium]
MKKYICIISFVIFVRSLILCQSKSELEIATGAIFFDQFGTSAQYDSYNGYTWQSDISFWKTFRTEKLIQPRIGVGYTFFWVLNIQNSSSPDTYISYIPIRFGLDYQLKKRKISFFSNISNYILASDKEPINEQRSFYSNLDLGIRIKTGKHWSLSLSSPITLLPMYYNEGITILTNPPSPEYDIWVENVGFMIGLKYRFD